jgi:hypothetical protein
MRCFQIPSSGLPSTRTPAQGTVEYGLVVAGGALLALLSYTLFSPIVTAAADQVKTLLPSFH